MIQINLLTKQKQTHREQTYGYQEERVDRRDGEFGIYMYTLLYLKWITNKDLLYSTWNSIQCYVAAWMGGSSGENGYMYMYVSILPQTLLPSMLPRDVEQSFMCSTVGPYWLSILNIAACTCPSQTP